MNLLMFSSVIPSRSVPPLPQTSALLLRRSEESMTFRQALPSGLGVQSLGHADGTKNGKKEKEHDSYHPLGKLSFRLTNTCHGKMWQISNQKWCSLIKDIKV